MDLQNKYQILATEFSKVRGQVTVLKKAVIDEQTKNHQLQVGFCLNYLIEFICLFKGGYKSKRSRFKKKCTRN
jgi:hypothetical protein